MGLIAWGSTFGEVLEAMPQGRAGGRYPLCRDAKVVMLCRYRSMR